jgi:hypothetical protein
MESTQVKQNSKSRKSFFQKTLCGIFVVCLWAGCKSPAGVAVSGTETTKAEEAFFASLPDHTFRFSTLSARIRLDLKSPQKEMSSKAQLKMIYGERMQISLQPFLGIEVFRIELTPDSVKILDRMNKRYMAESYEEMKGNTGVDFNFHNLQSLFTNNLFIPGERDLSPEQMRRFHITREPDAAHLNIKDKAGLSYRFTAGDDRKLRSASIRDKAGKYRITWDYSDFQSIGNQRFPFKMEAGWTADKHLQAIVAFTFSDAVINNPLKTEFNVPTGYTKVTFSQIIKLLDKQ